MAKELSMVERYDFVENKDYISFHKKMERVVGGTNLLKSRDFVCVSQKMKRNGRYDFVENQDFIKLHKKMKRKNQ